MGTKSTREIRQKDDEINLEIRTLRERDSSITEILTSYFFWQMSSELETTYFYSEHKVGPPNETKRKQ